MYEFKNDDPLDKWEIEVKDKTKNVVNKYYVDTYDGYVYKYSKDDELITGGYPK